MGIFTREEEELHVYDADAFFYFAGVMLLVVLLPWTFFVYRRLADPRPPEQMDFDARGRAPKGVVVRQCATAAMEMRRASNLQAAKSWRSRLGSGGMVLQLFGLLLLWGCFAAVACRLAVTPSELSVFDPYDILGIDRGASPAQIKKAYRTKSLAHHPDKDRENPLAPALFQQISKAYAALTDDAARQNYEKYGNPDGPSQMKVGIALHPAIVNTRQSRLTVLCSFFSVIIGVPLAVVFCCLRNNNKLAAHGVSNETLRVFHAVIDDEMRAEDGPGLFAASTEARLCGLMSGAQGGGDMRRLIEAMVAARPVPLSVGTLVQIRNAAGARAELNGRKGVLRRMVSDMTWLVEVFPANGPPTGPDQTTMQEFPKSELLSIEPRAPCPFSDAPIRRGTALLWAHMWRQHAHMDPILMMELTQMLTSSPDIIRSMVAIAAKGKGDRSGFFETVRGFIQFQRGIVQALDINSDMEVIELLQVPHVSKVPKPADGAAPPTLKQVVADEGGERKRLMDQLKLSPEQRLDVQAFCRHVPRMEVACTVEVDDEETIAEGDLATISVTLTRANLDEGEATGPVHAPTFPIPKFEEWWVLVYDTRARRFLTAEIVQGIGRTEKCKIRYFVPRSGDFHWTIYAMCDSYFGLDAQCDVYFKSMRKSQVNRDVFIHPLDANIKTWFEEIMEDLQPKDEESESEEEFPSSKAVAKKAEEEAKPQEEADGKAGEAAAEVAKEETKAKRQASLSDSDSDIEPEPEGVFHRVIHDDGGPIFAEPVSDDSEEGVEHLQVGCIPQGTIVRGYVDDGRPEGWMELAPGGQAWLRLDKGRTEEMGPLMAQKLSSVVQTPTPVVLVKRWMRNSEQEITMADVLQVRDIESDRVRLTVEELARERMGEEKFEAVQSEVFEYIENRKNRLTKARGHFMTQNGCVWHVRPNGKVRGLHPDGSRIRDNVEVSKDGQALDLGPFRLDETRSCSCIHWMRRDDPSGQKQWVWQQDMTLDSRVRIGSAF